MDVQVAGQLFGVFPDGHVPQAVELGALTTMLQTRPAARVIDVDNTLDTHHPSLFVPRHPQHVTAGLYSSIARALKARPADEQAGEQRWHDYWSRVLGGVFTAAVELIGMPLQWDRTVQDISAVTEAIKLRDYLLWYNSTVMVCAEEKPATISFFQAERDLYKKHSGSVASFYGQLKYLLGYARSGATIRFYALDLGRPGIGYTISDKLNTRNPEDRFRAVVATINIVRWINTVSNWLPDIVLPCRTLQWAPLHDLPGMYSEVQLFLGFNRVGKTYLVPRPRAEQLLCVLLSLVLLRHTVQIESLEVNGHVIKCPGQPAVGMPVGQELPQHILNVLVDGQNRFTLQMTPVGYVLPGRYSHEQLYHMVEQLLTVLKDLHALGYVHRDIRPDNIIFVGDEQVDSGSGAGPPRPLFVLADWELAASANFCQVLPGVKAWPAAVQQGIRGYSPHDDLGQVAAVITEKSHEAWTGALNFATLLQQPGMDTEQALAQLPNYRNTWSGAGPGAE